MGLTERASFDHAQQQGWEDLLDRSEFHSMIDLAGARQPPEPVTPLPIED